MCDIYISVIGRAEMFSFFYLHMSHENTIFVLRKKGDKQMNPLVFLFAYIN